MNKFMKKKYKWKILVMLCMLLIAGCCISLSDTQTTVYAASKTYRNQFVEKNGKLYYYADNGKIAKGWFRSKAGNRYYFTKKDGSVRSGIVNIAGKNYFFNKKGKMLTGFQTYKNKTYYFDKKTGAMATKWVTTKAGNKYYFWNDGAVRSGWQKINKVSYYFNEKGKMLTNSFKTDGKNKFYINKNGRKQLGVKKIGKYWYAFNSKNGILIKNDWYTDKNNNVYYATGDGKLAQGFYKPDNYYRYFSESDCKMAKGWQNIGKYRYYFNSATGRRYDNRQLKSGSGKMYIFNSDGHLFRNRTFKWSGNYYYAASNGVLYTGWVKKDGNQYYYSKVNGARKTGWITLGKNKYYLSPSTGILVTNDWIDKDHYVDESGVWIPDYDEVSFRWPLNSQWNYITSYFGYRESPGGIGSTNHGGIDIYAPTGTPIYAAASGTVTNILSPWESNGGGNYTLINHGNGLSTEYMHQSRFASGLKIGMKVKKGQIIGYVGTTGNVTGPHLHFGVKVDGVRQNPLNYVTQP